MRAATAPDQPGRSFAREFPLLFFGVIDVQYERGVYLPKENIWLDPWDQKPFAFV